MYRVYGAQQGLGITETPNARKFSVIYWALDMLLGFFTGFLDRGNLVQDLARNPGLGFRVEG